MQMLHPHRGSIQQYMEQIEDPDHGRPSSCPQCRNKEPLRAHGFYSRTIVDEAFDGWIRIRRYLCQACLRTVSLLPEWALPFMRFSIPVIAKTVKARLMQNQIWKVAAPAAPHEPGEPDQPTAPLPQVPPPSDEGSAGTALPVAQSQPIESN